MSRFKRNDGSVTRKSDFTLVLIIPMGILTTDFKNDTFKCQFRAARHKLGSLRRRRVSVLLPMNSYKKLKSKQVKNFLSNSHSKPEPSNNSSRGSDPRDPGYTNINLTGFFVKSRSVKL